ncbi:24579_t:CDS:1, partial [Gigaspora rosea]
SRVSTFWFFALLSSEQIDNLVEKVEIIASADWNPFNITNSFL